MEQFTAHIKSKTGWFDIDLRELYRYKDLIFLFVKRNYTTRYKQTILGPLWQVINPALTVALYAIVFGNIAKLSTDDVPQFVFYLCSNSLWAFFAACIQTTASTFTANAGILGKVYFPRLVMPISSVFTAMIDLAVQIAMLIVIMLGYVIAGYRFATGIAILLVPFIIIQISILGLGCGIIIAALTTKYRDLVVLVSFGVQLWMYASPIVYTVAQIPEQYYGLYMLNPIASIVTMWRYAILGTGTAPIFYWLISWGVTAVVLLAGVLLFSKVEKTFMDTV